MVSCGSPSGGIVVANSGIGGLCGSGRRWLDSRCLNDRSSGYGADRGLGRGQNFRLRLNFAVDVCDLGIDLGAKFVAGALEFVERLADLSSNLRQLLGPEDNEGQQEDENHLRKTEVHGYIITAGRGRQQCGYEPGSGAPMKSVALAPISAL